MPKYRATFETIAFVSVEIEADTEDEADEKAKNEVARVQLCRHCAQNIELEEIDELFEIELLEDSSDDD